LKLAKQKSTRKRSLQYSTTFDMAASYSSILSIKLGATMTTIYNIILFLFVLVIFFLDGIIGHFTVGWEAVATATTDAAPC
jgi:hypothetical protein